MANIHDYEGRLKKTKKKLFGEQSILCKEDKEDLDREKTDDYMNAIIQIPGVKEFIEEK